MNALRRTAVHEAGHAVFLWRGGELIYGEEFDDRRAPFRAIVLNAQDTDELGHLPPLRLEDGRSVDAQGSVIVDGFRLTVPAARRIDGLPRAKLLMVVERSRRQADALLLGLLAGPLVEEHFRATAEGDERYFDWSCELDQEDDHGDVTKALAIAGTELCRGHRQVVAYMNKAVARIEMSLDSDPRYWRAVMALAHSLEGQLVLEHDAAIAAMRGAWGCPKQ